MNPWRPLSHRTGFSFCVQQVLVEEMGSVPANGSQAAMPSAHVQGHGRLLSLGCRSHSEGTSMGNEHHRRVP
jgi:hypothetical protein